MEQYWTTDTDLILSPAGTGSSKAVKIDDIFVGETIGNQPIKRDGSGGGPHQALRSDEASRGRPRVSAGLISSTTINVNSNDK